MQQRKSEWLEKANHDYHDRQFKEPYRSTVAFCDWLEQLGLLSRESELDILDFGSGAGSNIFYMSRRYQACRFLGIDINRDLIDRGNRFFATSGVARCQLEVGDIYELDRESCGSPDGIISLQTLSSLPDYRAPLEAMTALSPSWIALSVLLYEGLVSVTREVLIHDKDHQLWKEEFYNIYSLPLLKEFLRAKGYIYFHSAPFTIDRDLPGPAEPGMGTYTRKLADGERIQFSGPLHMPWYFICAVR